MFFDLFFSTHYKIDTILITTVDLSDKIVIIQLARKLSIFNET